MNFCKAAVTAMYQLLQPHPDLLKYIEHYWLVRSDTAQSFDIRIDVFVDCRSDLIFNFGAGYTRQKTGGTKQVVTVSNFDAQRRYPIQIRQQGDVQICGVRFRPGGAAPFLKISASHCTDRMLQPRVCFGEHTVALEARLKKNLQNTETLNSLLDEFFLSELSYSAALQTFYQGLAEVHYADTASNESALVTTCCSKLDISERTLHRYFMKYLGVSLKQYHGIARFQKVLHQLMEKEPATLASIAQACGYYDQPHLIREFKKYTGSAPRVYRGYYPTDIPSDFAPNIVRFVQE